MRTNPPDTVEGIASPLLRSERIEDYLDHLCGPLLDDVPFRERCAFRGEAEDHIYSLIAEYEASGRQTAGEATIAALRDYGEPWQVGKAFLEAWREQVQRGRESHQRRHFRTAVIYAFALFGLSSVAVIGILQVNRTFLKPNQVLFLFSNVLVVILPAIAGCVVGVQVRIRPARTVCVAIIPVLIHSFLTGILMSSHPEFRTLTVTQCLYWLPVGMVSAALTNILCRHRRRRTYLQRIRL